MENPHSVATVLKRWYKELPKRLLVDMDPAIGNRTSMKRIELLEEMHLCISLSCSILNSLNAFTALDDRVLRSYDYLNDCYRHLLLWLTDILVRYHAQEYSLQSLFDLGCVLKGRFPS